MKLIKAKKTIILIAVIVILFGIIATGYFYVTNKHDIKIREQQEKIRNEIVSVLTMDINPSIELNLNKDNEIVNVKALNEDSKKLLENKNFKWNTLEEGMTIIIDLLKDNNYLNEEKNTILINVKSENSELSNIVENSVEKITKEKEIVTDIVMLAVEETEELKELAEQNNITISKAYYIEEQIKDEEGLTFEDLKDTSINDIKTKVEDYKEEQERIKKEEEERKQKEEQKKSQSSTQSGSGVRSGSLKICESAQINFSNNEAKNQSLDTIGADNDARAFSQTTAHNYNGICSWETTFYYNGRKYLFYHNVTTGELLYQTSSAYAASSIDAVNNIVKDEFTRRFGASRDEVFVEGIDEILTYSIPNCTATAKYNDTWYTIVINKQSGAIISFNEGSKYH